MAQEPGEHGVAAVVLSPVGLRDGWVSSGAELRSIHEALATPAALDAQLREDPRLANRQTPEYAGRAVAMLAADPRVLARTGRALKVSNLAHEYVWRRRILAPSRSSPIDAVQATEDGAGADRAGQWLDAPDGSVELQRAVRALRVVVARVLVRTARRCASLRMITWSRHSRRRVPTSRSATALARGARTGVSTVRIPSPAARVAKSAP